MKDMRTLKSDGCTMFPDSAAWGKEWTPCCYAHDLAYWIGGTKEDRKIADKALFNCVKEAGHPIIAYVMYFGVRVFGGAHFPLINTRVGWGYGHGDSRRGYVKTTKAEDLQIARYRKRNKR